MKGMFMTTNNIDNGISANSVMMSEIPVTPPSIKELGSKNPFNPKLAENTPNKIKKLSRMKWVNSTLASITFFSNSFGGSFCFLLFR